MRIMVGTVEIAGQLPLFADGFRQLGHQVTTVIQQRSELFPHIKYDVDIAGDVIPRPKFAQSHSRFIRLPWSVPNRLLLLSRLLWLISSHDVFVFQWAGRSLQPNNAELPLLKKLGKKVVYFCSGGDVRHWSAYQQRYGIDLRSFEKSYDEPIVRTLQNLRRLEAYSDLILSVPNEAELAIRPHLHFFVPVNLSQYQCLIPGREIPIVVHAPSLLTIKGSDLILSTLERLRSEGVCFELRLLHGVPNSRVLEELTNADVGIDQLYIPLHGKFGVEVMASGCALATCNREDKDPFPPNRPIWHIEPANLYEQLKRLLTDRELRMQLAQKGRQYVEQYHDHVKIARRILERLETPDKTYDYYPTFFARHYRLPEGETIPDDLKCMTAQIIQKWGLPENVDPRDLIWRGLMSAEGLDLAKPIPRWESAPGHSNRDIV